MVYSWLTRGMIRRQPTTNHKRKTLLDRSAACISHGCVDTVKLLFLVAVSSRQERSKKTGQRHPVTGASSVTTRCLFPLTYPHYYYT
jgi:hypothetical protein